ncbi:MAG: hypothetical protein PVF87_03940 [Acidimicrobiia bacterium]|jgi:hypothetical protein
MDPIEILLAAILVFGWLGLAVALGRQGHPGDRVRRDMPENPGPTGEAYPTGSRPAGPGAESMIAEPSPRKGSSDRRG